MKNSKQVPAASLDQPFDTGLEQLYQQLPPETPSTHIDQAIIRQARNSALGGRWIWPVSMAASLVLCTTLVVQMARVVQPQPATIGLNNRPAAAPLAQAPVSAPAVGGVSDGVSERWISDASEALTSAAPGSSEPRPETWPETWPEFWWEQLRMHADNADREGFLVTWAAYQAQRDDTPLPDDLRRWMADNRVDPTPLPEG